MSKRKHRGKHLRLKLLRSAGRRCYYCGTALSLGSMILEHKVPLSRGGPDRKRNLAVSCRPCDIEKGERTADEYLAYKTGFIAGRSARFEALHAAKKRFEYQTRRTRHTRTGDNK